MKLSAQGCEHSICKDCSESPPPKCPVAKCNRGVYPDDPVFIVDKALMVAVNLTERPAQSASATLVSVSPQYVRPRICRAGLTQPAVDCPFQID